jgi:hypothetical protein
VLAAFSGTRSDRLLVDGHSTAAALTGGYHVAVAAVLVVAAIVSPVCSEG